MTLEPETLVRLIFFVGILGLLVLLEWLSPRRRLSMRQQRWPSNLAVVMLYTGLLWLIPISPQAAALQSIVNKFGLFFWSPLAPLPLWWRIGITLLVLDLMVYWQHRWLHRLPLLWRLHRMHHSDHAFDVTTALRFHPLEILLSALLKAATVFLLGAPLLAVVLFEILLNGCAMFNHSNLRLPTWLERGLRYIIVTPDMHRIHHSTQFTERERNFGFSLSLWDRLFGSYQAEPEAGHTQMSLGLPEFADLRESRLDRMLLQPWR